LPDIAAGQAGGDRGTAKSRNRGNPACGEPERRQGRREHDRCLGNRVVLDKIDDAVDRVDNGVEDITEEVTDSAEDVVEEVVPIRVDEGQRVVADIGIAVPALRVHRVGDRRIRAGEPRQDRIIDRPSK
jgi:hypothetical protein